MKIEINEAERFIKIKDLAKFNYFMLIMVLMLVLVQSILNLEKLKIDTFDWTPLARTSKSGLLFNLEPIKMKQTKSTRQLTLRLII